MTTARRTADLVKTMASPPTPEDLANKDVRGSVSSPDLAAMERARTRWLAEGVPADALATLESMAPLTAWDIHWESHLGSEARFRLACELGRHPDSIGPSDEPGHFVTRLRCPLCGEQGTYVLNAVDDFHCDDEDCGFDVYDNEAGLVPQPGTF